MSPEELSLCYYAQVVEPTVTYVTLSWLNANLYRDEWLAFRRYAETLKSPLFC